MDYNEAKQRSDFRAILNYAKVRLHENFSIIPLTTVNKLLGEEIFECISPANLGSDELFDKMQEIEKDIDLAKERLEESQDALSLYEASKARLEGFIADGIYSFKDFFKAQEQLKQVNKAISQEKEQIQERENSVQKRSEYYDQTELKYDELVEQEQEGFYPECKYVLESTTESFNRCLYEKEKELNSIGIKIVSESSKFNACLFGDCFHSEEEIIKEYAIPLFTDVFEWIRIPEDGEFKFPFAEYYDSKIQRVFNEHFNIYSLQNIEELLGEELFELLPSNPHNPEKYDDEIEDIDIDIQALEEDIVVSEEAIATIESEIEDEIYEDSKEKALIELQELKNTLAQEEKELEELRYKKEDLEIKAEEEEQAFDEWETPYPLHGTLFEARTDEFSDMLLENEEELRKENMYLLKENEYTRNCIFLCSGGHCFFDAYWKPLFSDIFRIIPRPKKD
jgi:hypothetical protein